MADLKNQNPDQNIDEQDSARQLRRAQIAQANQKKPSSAEESGKDVVKLAKQTASKLTLNIAFDALPTLYGSIPAFLYLNFYLIKSAFFNSDESMAKMNIGQLIIILSVDLLILFIVLIILVIIAILAHCLSASGFLQCVNEIVFS